MFFVENETDESIDLDRVNEVLNTLTSYLKEERDFSVTFIDDNSIKELNRDYRNMDNPTDILTFRLADGDDDFPIMEDESEMGDIFISLESMRRNAKEFGVEEEEELTRLLLHGLLHLRGLDHSTNDFNKEPMLIEQETILANLRLK